MNTISKLPINLILLISTCIFLGCNSSGKQPDINESKNTIVLVKYKAQPDKGSEAVSELTKLIEKVKQEPHFKKITLHVDSKDDTNILLYEEWEDESYYNSEHMNTVHLKEFISNSRNFLAGPPEISLWNVENIFK
jgi:quinol monooxygenase YgiN